MTAKESPEHLDPKEVVTKFSKEITTKLRSERMLARWTDPEGTGGNAYCFIAESFGENYSKLSINYYHGWEFREKNESGLIIWTDLGKEPSIDNLLAKYAKVKGLDLQNKDLLSELISDMEKGLQDTIDYIEHLEELLIEIANHPEIYSEPGPYDYED